jgi:hypothetical protein
VVNVRRAALASTATPLARSPSSPRFRASVLPRIHGDEDEADSSVDAHADAGADVDADAVDVEAIIAVSATDHGAID